MTIPRQPLKVRYTIKADADLSSIWSYLTENGSESRAYEFNSRIHRRIQQAALFPFSGAPRPHLAQHMRVLFYQKYAIYYLPGAEEIIVVRVLHGARDIAAIAEEGGFVI